MNRPSLVGAAAPRVPVIDRGKRIPCADLLRHGFDIHGAQERSDEHLALWCPRCAALAAR